MAKRIREDLIGVVLTFDRDGNPVQLKAGDTVPKGLELGKHVLQKSDDSPTSGKGETNPGSPPASSADAVDASALEVPPKSGSGSGADKWRDYAVAAAKARDLSITIAADASRADIIEALESAQIPTE